MAEPQEDENVNVKVDDGQVKEDPYIPGTNFKTKDEAAQGWNSLNEMKGKQSNEIGALRQQVEMQQQVIASLTPAQQAAQEAAQGPDYETEIEGIYGKMEGLDIDAPDYGKQITQLTRQSNQLTAQMQHDRTLKTAMGKFQEELGSMKKEGQYNKFYEQNPEFKTPEMQARIKEYVANDPTGLSDSLDAFRAIQRDDLAAKTEELTKRNAELEKLVALKGGTDSTGTVITKAQSVQTKNEPPLRGAALKQAQVDAFNAAAS